MKGKSKMQFFLAALLLFCVGFDAAVAAEYPEKPITLILNVRPGGSHDLNARVFTGVIPQYLGQSMIIKFMPGASGQTGTAAGVKARPDGYTLLYTSSYEDTLVPLIEQLPYETMGSLATVCRTNYAAPIIFVAANKPWKTLKEMLQYGKENPGKLKFCHAGNWGPIFTPGAFVLTDAGVDAKYIPYDGGGPAVQGTLAGDGDFSAAFPSVIISLYQAGKIRCLAVLGEKRSSDFPDVPTLNDLGIKSVQALQMHRIIQVPRGVPEDRMKILRDVFQKINEDVSYKLLMGKLGENLEWMDGPEYDQKVRPQLKNEYEKLVKTITGEKTKSK